MCERVEGLPLELFLALACRLTGADRRMIVTAGEVLADLPATARLFRDGAISWGQVRAIVGAVRRLPAADRAEIDARVAASAERFEGIDAYDPDQLVWAVDQAVEQLRDGRSVERTQERRRASSFLSVQAALDGGMRLYGELDAVKAAPVLNALDAAAGAPAEDVAYEAIDGSDGPAWSGTARGRQYADALESVCAEWLGGGSGRRARPLLVAHVDVSQLRAEAGGTVELAVRGDLPRLSAAALEALAASADVRAVAFDGARPPRSVVIGVGAMAATNVHATSTTSTMWSIGSMGATTIPRISWPCRGGTTAWRTATAGGCASRPTPGS